MYILIFAVPIFAYLALVAYSTNRVIDRVAAAVKPSKRYEFGGVE